MFLRPFRPLLQSPKVNIKKKKKQDIRTGEVVQGIKVLVTNPDRVWSQRPMWWKERTDLCPLTSTYM